MNRTVTYFRVMDKPDCEITAKIKAVKMKKYVDTSPDFDYIRSYHDAGFLYDGYYEMLKDAELKSFDTVYVRSLSEWGFFNWTERIDQLDKLGITVVFRHEGMTGKDILSLRRRHILCQK